MIEEDLFEQEIQKKKRRVLVLLVCLFVLAGGGFIARKTSLAESEGAATPVQVADAGAQSAPVETPASGGLEVSEKSDSQPPDVEVGLSEHEGQDTIAEAGSAIGAAEQTPTDSTTEEEKAEDSDSAVTEDDESTADDGGSETGSSDDQGVDKPVVVDDEDDGEFQAGGEIGTATDSGDEVTSEEVGTVIAEESTTDLDDDVDAVDSDDDQAHDGASEAIDTEAGQPDSVVVGGVTDGLGSDENQTVAQTSDQEQAADFQPAPAQLPVTGSVIINWGVAPIVAITLVILLVGTGVSSLYSSKHRRY